MSKIAWPDLMRFGLVQFRLPPDVFWSLTPAELMFLARDGQTMPANMNRSGLDRLMELFPDKSNEGPRNGGD